jgi:hypothetical protein
MNLTKPPEVENQPPSKLTISQLVTAVRDELDKIELERNVRGRLPMFQLSKMEIEVQFVVKVDETVKGGFDLQVFSVGGKRAAGTEKTQVVTLSYDLLPEAAGAPGARAYPGGKGGAVPKGIHPL